MPRKVRQPDTAKSASDSKQYVAHVELPDPLPVTEQELDLLEVELADCIDELLER